MYVYEYVLVHLCLMLIQFNLYIHGDLISLPVELPHLADLLVA